MDSLDELRHMFPSREGPYANATDADPAQCLSYTVGLGTHGHPEIVMTGLPSAVATTFLNVAGQVVVHGGGRFHVGDTTTELADGSAMPIIEVVDRSGLTATQARYGDVAAVQILWTHSRGMLPWEEGYANPPGFAALLGPRQVIPRPTR